MERRSDEVQSWPFALWIGVTLSVLWFVVLAVYAVQTESALSGAQQVTSAAPDAVSHWNKFWHNSPDAFGNALAGVFAPLAFLWLVVATFLQKDELIAQRKELVQSRKALELQAQELQKSVEQFTNQTSLLDEQVTNERSAILARSIRKDIENFVREAGSRSRYLRPDYSIRPPHHNNTSVLDQWELISGTSIVGAVNEIKTALDEGRLNDALSEIRTKLRRHTEAITSSKFSVSIGAAFDTNLHVLLEDLKRIKRRCPDTHHAVFWSELREFKLDQILNDLAMVRHWAIEQTNESGSPACG